MQTMKIRTACCLILLLAIPVLAAEPLSDVVRDEARRILANVQTTRYDHHTDVDETAGRYDLDCSALATLILKKIAPKQLRAVRHAETTSHPRAFEFYDTFAAATGRTGWLRVPNLLDARPGDFIAWRKVHIIPGESTGHIVIVDAAPAREINGTVRVTVIDSTNMVHAHDTRPPGDSGIGRGTMWFTIDAAGNPVGVLRKSPNDQPRGPVPIAIGRVMLR